MGLRPKASRRRSLNVAGQPQKPARVLGAPLTFEPGSPTIPNECGGYSAPAAALQAQRRQRPVRKACSVLTMKQHSLRVGAHSSLGVESHAFRVSPPPRIVIGDVRGCDRR